MSATEGALDEARWPLFGGKLWMPVLLVLLACAAIVFEGVQIARTLQQSVELSARVQGTATAREIGGFIAREQERLQAFVSEKEAEIRQVVTQPQDQALVERLQASVRRMFPGSLAFSVTDSAGRPVFADFEGLVGAVCQAAMRDYVQAVEQKRTPAIPPIHPVPDAYHFDLITPWRLDNGRSGLFFVSMHPRRIAELLAAAERLSGSRILLVNRDDPTLIEVTAAGARDVLGQAIRLSPDALGAGHFAVDLPATHWRLLVLPDREAYAEAMLLVYITVAGLVLGLLLISAALLYLIRRSEQNNSSLFMRSLQSSLSRQRAILQSMVDGMVTIDAKGTIHHVNGAITRLFGYEPKELIGSNVRVLMPEPDRSAHDGYLHSYLTTGESKILGKGREVMARRKDGSVFPVLLTLGESIEGEEHIFVGILHDMSAYRDAQRRIVAQDMAIRRSNQELEEISQIAARDLQQPLQRIASLGAALGIAQAAGLSGNEKAQLAHLASEARDVSEMVKGLADYTGLERRSATDRVQLDQVLADVQRDLAATIADTGATVEVEPLGEVVGDARQLHQVFWNLLDNALKFRDPARSPQIRVSLAPAEVADESRQTVLVEDNGIGIPPEQSEAIFEAFRRLHPRSEFPGMGLGLSFCRKIVEGLDGRIGVRSRSGVGATFEVTLPRA